MRAVPVSYLKQIKTKTSKSENKQIDKFLFITTIINITNIVFMRIINITNLVLMINICSSRQQSFSHLFVAHARSHYEGSVSTLLERKQNQNIKSQNTIDIPQYKKHDNHKYHKHCLHDLHLLQQTTNFQPPLCGHSQKQV